jgi:ABC-type iron transport system FetAB ATPase subunit
MVAVLEEDDCVKKLRIENLKIINLAPVQLVLEAGECVSLAGPSGSGKSLLLRAIADLDPHQGDVFLDNESCDSMEGPEWRRQVVLLAAESQWWDNTVGEHFKADSPGHLEQLGFPADVMQWQISRLSTGEKQRLALLRLFCNQPLVLLLDEPTANLDEDSVKKVEQMIESYRKEHNAAVLWVTHDTAQRARVATRHYDIIEGRVEQVELKAGLQAEVQT